MQDSPQKSPEFYEVLLLSELFRVVFCFAFWTNLWHFGHPKGIKLQGFELNLEVLCTTLCTTSNSDFWFTEKLSWNLTSQLDITPKTPDIQHHVTPKRLGRSNGSRPASSGTGQDKEPIQPLQPRFLDGPILRSIQRLLVKAQSLSQKWYEWRERCLIRSWGEVMVDGISWILNIWEFLFNASMVPPKSLSTNSRCCFHQFLIVTLI